MRHFERPRVVVSKCLGFEACRYNGERLSDPLVKRLEPFVDFVPVCPEVEVGLGTPRPTLRLHERGGEVRLVQPETGRDLTETMAAFSAGLLEGLGPVDGFLFKSRSPSCGLGDVKVYKGESAPSPVGRGAGRFAGEARARLPLAAMEDEGRTRSFSIREHFLTQLFASAALRHLAARPSMGALVRFHSVHKLVLLAHSQKEMRLLGKIVANPERRPLPVVVADYDLHFRTALHRPARYTSHLNVLEHAFGYFKKELVAREKRHFLRTLAQYAEGKFPLSVPLALIRSWVERYDEPYLANQAYFEPYPEALVEITDSGKGRDR